MKKIVVLSTLLMLMLAACSAATSTEQAAPSQDATAIANIVSATQTALAPLPTLATDSINTTRLTTEYDNAAPVSMQLIVGIMQLENTNLAVTSTQAESFITVLNFLKDLSRNTAATQEQFDTLIDQAQSILTDEQVGAIAQMKITQDSVMALIQQQGGPTQGQGTGNPPAQGDMPQGTPPADGPGEQPPAEGPQPGTGFLPPQLIDTLIQLMESKITSS